MANRVKEDERNERIIRNLLKLPDNRRCINCNNLGPQYVCTNFSTFICTNCSGIHREFTHRVKSVSIAKFTPLEVSALQGGGNASAREIYLKEWDPQRNTLPDGRNIERLRDFIKHVYVDRRFTGERILEKTTRDKMGESGDLSGSRGIETYQSGSRSPSIDDGFERRHGDKPITGGRSPEYRQSSNYRRTSGTNEVVNDWRREDRFGNILGLAERSSDEEPKLDSRSPDRVTDPDFPSSPEVRPVREILGDSVLRLRVIEPPNAAGARSTDGYVRSQRNASSSSLASSDGNPSEIKVVDAPFINFDSVPVPAFTVTSSQIHQAPANESSIHLTTSNSNDWANFDSFTGVKAPSNTLESVLSGSSIPATAPSVIPLNVQPSNITSSAFSASRPGDNGQSRHQTITPVSGLYSSNKPLNPQAQITQQPRGPFLPGASNEANSYMGNSVGSTKRVSLESESSGRKALPEDLFSMNYSYGQPPHSAWYHVPRSPYIAGLPMHYNTPVAPLPVPNYSATAKSINPFAVGDEPSHAQASMFPSVASLQSALPKTATNVQMHVPPQPNAMSMMNQSPIYASSPIPQSSFMTQNTAGIFPTRPQSPSSLNSETFGFAPPNQHIAHSSSNSFTSGGNPFG